MRLKHWRAKIAWRWVLARIRWVLAAILLQAWHQRVAALLPIFCTAHCARPNVCAGTPGEMRQISKTSHGGIHSAYDAQKMSHLNMAETLEQYLTREHL